MSKNQGHDMITCNKKTNYINHLMFVLKEGQFGTVLHLLEAMLKKHSKDLKCLGWDSFDKVSFVKIKLKQYMRFKIKNLY